MGWPGPPAGLPRALLRVGSGAFGPARLRVLCEKRFYKLCSGSAWIYVCFLDLKRAFCSQIRLQLNLLHIRSICIS
ncbi:hypothetical protein Nmel_006047 [Mimus melanotis]